MNYRLNTVLVFNRLENFYGIRIGLVAFYSRSIWPVYYPVIRAWEVWCASKPSVEYTVNTLGMDGVE